MMMTNLGWPTIYACLTEVHCIRDRIYTTVAIRANFRTKGP